MEDMNAPFVFCYATFGCFLLSRLASATTGASGAWSSETSELRATASQFFFFFAFAED